MDVSRLGTQLHFARAGQPVVVARLAVPGHVDRAGFDGFLQCALAPRTGQDIVGGRAIRREQIHRHHRELQPGAALQEQYPVVLRDGQQLGQSHFRRLQDRLENLAAVADFQDRRPGTRQSQQLALSVFEHRQGKHRGSGRKIENTLRHRCGTMTVRRRGGWSDAFISGGNARPPAPEAVGKGPILSCKPGCEKDHRKPKNGIHSVPSGLGQDAVCLSRADATSCSKSSASRMPFASSWARNMARWWGATA